MNAAEPGEEEEKEVIDPLTLQPQLYAAASLNNTAQVLQYVEMGVPVTHMDSRSGFTALHWAALNGNVVLVKKLLENGASEAYHTCKAKQVAASKATKKKAKQQANASSSHAEGGADEEKNNATDEHTPTHTHDEAAKEEEDEDENEEDDTFDNHISLEVTHDFTKNTPLLWATQRGHLRVIWLLLGDGYSPNDVDKMGNNAMHLAAALGDPKILQILTSDGGNANVVNHYKNLPIDMAKNKAVRDLLQVSMVQHASLTDEDRARKHEQNMKQYSKMMNTLIEAVSEATVARQQSITGGVAVSKKINGVLLDAIHLGQENALDENYILQAEDLLRKIEASQELHQSILSVQNALPIRDQTTYLETVSKLEKSIERAIAQGIEVAPIQLGLELVARCQSEYWLSILLGRLKDVTSANDSNEHDMNKLRKAIHKAQSLQADEEILEGAYRLLNRLDAELSMNRALRAIPAVKLPMDNAPEGYYTERDTGKIKETEGYPLPPADTGEYVWIPAEAMVAFVEAVNRLRAAYQSAEGLHANPAIVQESKDRIAKAEKEIKLLENKDAADKAAAIEVAKKLAKKLKSGKKKK